DSARSLPTPNLVVRCVFLRVSGWRRQPLRGPGQQPPLAAPERRSLLLHSRADCASRRRTTGLGRLLSARSGAFGCLDKAAVLRRNAATPYPTLLCPLLELG